MIAPLVTVRSVTIESSVTPAASRGLVLSLFPGADLLGKGFEAEGFCVVRGPEKILGGDIREFHCPAGVVEGIIGGPPCQDFSRARRTATTGYGLEMLREFARVVGECEPVWWLMENVATVPDVEGGPYHVQRFDLRADECGLGQTRLRHFQFGSLVQWERLVIPRSPRIIDASRTALASEGRRKHRRTFDEFCALQGVQSSQLSHEWLTKAGRYGVVGNGVPVPMARVIARAIATRASVTGQAVPTCACGCGRLVNRRRTLAEAACRKREQRRRGAESLSVEQPTLIP